VTGWFERALLSDPAIVAYTLVGLLAFGVALWVSPVGKWFSARLEESRQHRHLDLLREFHTEMAPVRKSEVSAALKSNLNGSLPRIEDKIDVVRNELHDSAAKVAARLAVGSQKLDSIDQKLGEHDDAIAGLRLSSDGLGNKVMKLETMVYMLKDDR